MRKEFDIEWKQLRELEAARVAELKTSMSSTRVRGVEITPPTVVMVATPTRVQRGPLVAAMSI